MSRAARPPLDFNPPYLHPTYPLTVQRAPSQRLVELPRGWFHTTPGPVFGHGAVRPGENDLTTQHEGQPIGQKIILSGRVLDSDGRPAAGTLIELWQANAAGRYLDPHDPHNLPLDPNFDGLGRCLTDSEGRYRFTTIRPAAYCGPVGTSFRPGHVHVSLIGSDLSSRLVTQCYFEGDPLIWVDHVTAGIPDPRGVERLIARHDPTTTIIGYEESALGYRWDIVLRGQTATPLDHVDDRR